MHILLAEAEPGRAGTVEAALFQAGATALSRPEPGEPLLEAVLRIRPDLVIVDMQRPDRDALDDLRHLMDRDPRPIVMFVDEDDPGFMQEAIAAGVSSYNVVSAEPPDVKPIIRAAIAIFDRLRQLETELRRAEAFLQDRITVDRAKAVLIRTRRMSEPQAYHWLRRQAMQRGRRIAEVAAEIAENTRDG